MGIVLSNFLNLALPFLGYRYFGFLSPVYSIGPVQFQTVSKQFQCNTETDIKCRGPQKFIIISKSRKTCEKFDFISYTWQCTPTNKCSFNIKLLRDSRGRTLKMDPNSGESSHQPAASSDKSLPEGMIASGDCGDDSKPKHSKPKHSKPTDDKPKDAKPNEDKPNRAFPTHFVSIQISNPEVLKALSDVQQAVLKAEKNLETSFVSIATAHLTLMLIRLETEEEIEKAGLSLERCLNDHWSGYVQGSDVLELEVAGLGHFDHQVMFAKISPGSHLEQLSKIAESVEKCLSEDGIQKAETKPFKPHLTLMKFTRERARTLRKKGITKIDPKFYKEFLETRFGVDVMKSVQLCSMMKPKDKETGYYHIERDILCGNSKDIESSDIQQAETSDVHQAETSDVHQA